eukprot:TRINITY_DN50199_c0_g1_i1.p1 TRINITY_DN50199_c0_g1~~TRINITY_DN50199_c0_g1_i1.p1  ORF type:complete len:865 (-),score=216.78 TRINITY_DN50199_c0_g1_i1:134-2728(-)
MIAGVAKLAFRRALPDADGKFEAAELEKAASIKRDEFGVPHITAETEKDVWFLNGVCHGQDRLWQLHSSRMLASGRLCELAGAKALELDRLLRRIGLRRLAEEDLANLRDSDRPEARQTFEMLEAYTKGVNWAFNNAGAMPVEFWLTGQRKVMEPWTAVDSLCVMRLYGFVMSFGWQQTLIRQALSELFGRERALAWTNTSEKEPEIPCTVDKEAWNAFKAADLSGALGPAVDQLPRGQGSNWWVVHGKHTKSGKPILVGDPHLSIKIPCFWYEVHMTMTSGPGFDAYGVAPPGAPGVMIGTNGHYACSITLAYTHVEDIFMECVNKDGKYLHKGQWQSCEETTETIQIKGGTPETIVCRKTCHGILLEGNSLLQYQPLSKLLPEASKVPGVAGDEEATICLAYAGLPLQPKVEAFVGMRKLIFAKSFGEFDTALSYVSQQIALNFSYADVDGHIGYVMTGQVPIRGQAPRGSEKLPMPGWTGEYDWSGFVTHADLPKAFDPPSGILISANHKAVDYDSYPHYVGDCFKSGYRAQAIEHELQELLKLGKLSPEQMPAILMNVRSWAAVAFVEEIKAVTAEADTATALGMLKAWDGTLATDSVIATLYQFTHAELLKLLLEKGLQTSEPTIASRLEGFGMNQATAIDIINGAGFDPLSALKILNEFQGHVHLNLIRILRSANKGATVDDPLHWWLVQAGGRDVAVNAAVRAAVAKLEGIAGAKWAESVKVTWGEVHTCHMVHPMSKNIGMTTFDGPSVPQGGDTNTICQTAVKSLDDFTATSSNVSLRVIFDLSDLRNKESNSIVLPLGQSGQFNSPHYCDQTPLWSQGKLRSMIYDASSVQQAAAATMTFAPAAQEAKDCRACG